MSLSGNQKALMYALGAVARGGATRGGYHSMLPYISIGGSVAPGGARVLVADLTISDILDETPNTCQLTVMGTAPPPGADLVITLGSVNSGTRLFAGKILSEEQGYYAQKPANVYHRLNGIDYTWLLAQHLVIRQYTNQTVAAIATDLIASFAEGMTAHNIAPDAGAIVIDAISYTNVALADALTQLCSRAGAYWYLDYFRDLHLFDTESTIVYPDPTPLTPAHPTLQQLTINEDLSQIATRVLVEGGGGTVIVDAAPGETIVPVDTVGWYQAAGGQVAAGAQRLRYGGIAASDGVGSTVGPGLTPSTALKITPVAGVGVDAGTHIWAYTWLTPAGETVPGPLMAAATPIQTAPPPTAPIVSLQGTSVGYIEPGSYDYVVTFMTASGETTPGPISNVITVPAPGGITSLNNLPIGPAEVTQRRIYRRQNGAGAFKLVVTISNNTNSFYGDGTGNAFLGANAPTANTTAAGQFLLQGVSVGPGATTSRKVYRTTTGGTQLKLAATLADNTTTSVVDALADAGLAANAPTADTSGLQPPNGTVLAGSPTLLLAGMSPAFSPTGGWAIVGNGEVMVRYSGISGNNLTGIPPTGVGAITSTIAYGALCTAAPALTGVPASGVGAIVYGLKTGDGLNLLVTVDDVPAQTALAGLIGGSGIKEAYIQDRRIGYPEAVARGQAMIDERADLLVEVHYVCRDVLTKSGRTIHAAMPAPTNLGGDYKIQQVTISGFSAKPGQPPTYTVQASSQRYSLDDLLRIARGTIGA